MARIDMQHVPYKGMAPALNDVLAGQVQMLFDNFRPPTCRCRRQAARRWRSPGRRGTTAPRSARGRRDVPGYEAIGWFGWLAPAGTPAPIRPAPRRRGLALPCDPRVSDRLAEAGLDIVANTPEQFAAFIREESVKWKRVVEISGAQAE